MTDELSILVHEFLDQVNYGCSSEFKEKWRHKYSTTFINVFQEYLIKALTDQKPVKKSTLVSAYTKRYKYSIDTVTGFFKDIDLCLYYPIIYEDRRFLRQRQNARQK
jgi:hypothetical protein